MHIQGITAPIKDKALFLVEIFNMDSIKACKWTKKNYENLADLLREVHDKNAKRGLLIAFNALPGVQQDRNKQDPEKLSPMWEELYFVRKANVRSETR